MPTPRPTILQAQLAAADFAFAGNDADAAHSTGCWRFSRAAPPASVTTLRERLLEYFELLGADDPRVAPARRELARVLF